MQPARLLRTAGAAPPAEPSLEGAGVGATPGYATVNRGSHQGLTFFYTRRVLGQRHACACEGTKKVFCGPDKKQNKA